MLDSLAPRGKNAIAIEPMQPQDLQAWTRSRRGAREWLRTVGFQAQPGTFAFVPQGPDGAARVLATPLGGDRVWAWAGLPMSLPEGRYRLAIDGDAAAQTDAALGWALGAYDFTRYRRPRRTAARLEWPQKADRGEVERLAASVFLARDLINTPCEDMGPAQLAAAAATVAREFGATVKTITGKQLLARNYPTIHMVGRASAADRQPRLVDIRWGDPHAPKVTLVGKGVCFDTGGLDIKPHEGMREMKKDMGGAAVMLGLARALMSAGVPIRLRLLIPAVENSVSANAFRPLDIVRTRAGKTVEIGNTDAEGRLILCDALAEADSEKPELLVDAATLTGAARMALGPEVQALFCDDDEAATALVRHGLAVGDPLWRLPLWRPYRKLIDGKCADLNNVAAGPFAGSIIGALYLAEFVAQAKTWVHLDIMAANTAAKPGRPEGGEATGMRALYAYIRSRFG
ncbi:MAG: leucyl aminopeptidase family protein [Burkholderiales bacterium]|nr:leucyl aminopeptidase family protein [Burkholderiales bacterium]